jgi:FkbM family methyltransferase
MRYEFVDIGTSFFCTSVDDYGLNVNGLLVEPIKAYLDVIPSSDTVLKANYAVSDTDGKGVMFARAQTDDVTYVSKQQLAEMRANNEDLHAIGVRGCNSLDNHHPMGGSSEHSTCDVVTFDTLCEKYNITEVGQLKIDTEGHEHKILPQVLSAIKLGKVIVTDRIVFEYNNLSNKTILDDIVKEFEQLDFTSEHYSDGLWDNDIILTKKR